MNRRKRNQKRRSRIWILICLGITGLAGILFLLPAVLQSGSPDIEYENTDTEERSLDLQTETVQMQSAADRSAEPAISGMTFPVSLENGQLEINSFFPYDGINPDCGNQEGRKIGAVVIRNTSGSYLTEAEITVILTDGTECIFRLTDLPAGKSAMVFDSNNTVVDTDGSYIQIDVEVEFDKEITTVNDKVKTSADGTTVTVQNTTGELLEEIVVFCRSPLGEEYFGGITYQYTITNLPAYGSTTVDAEECILGMTEVIRTAVN